MFGDMMGMMGKVKEAKAKAEETRIRLAKEELKEFYKGVEVIVNGANEVVHISWESEAKNDPHFPQFVKTAINLALQKSKALQESELKKVAKEHLPNIPGLGNMLGF